MAFIFLTRFLRNWKPLNQPTTTTFLFKNLPDHCLSSIIFLLPSPFYPHYNSLSSLMIAANHLHFSPPPVAVKVMHVQQRRASGPSYRRMAWFWLELQPQAIIFLEPLDCTFSNHPSTFPLTWKPKFSLPYHCCDHHQLLASPLCQNTLLINSSLVLMLWFRLKQPLIASFVSCKDFEGCYSHLNH